MRKIKKLFEKIKIHAINYLPYALYEYKRKRGGSRNGY